jgi:lipopolysaccharide export system permease protein
MHAMGFVGGPLARYLRGMLLTQVLGIVVALTALLQVLELLDVTTDILQRKLGLAGVAHYAMLRLPSEFVLALPLAMLVGSLFTFYTLARNHELVAIRASGLRLRWIVGALLPVAIGFAVLQFVVADRIVPSAEAALADWWAVSDPDANAESAAAGPGSDAETEADDQPRWFRTRNGLVAIEHASRDGRDLQGISIYLREKSGEHQGQYAGRVTAQAGHWRDGGWQFEQVTELHVGDQGAQRQTSDVVDWDTNLRPSDVAHGNGAQLPLSSTALLGVLAGRRVGDRPASYYRTALYKAYLAPVTLTVMLLLALPATLAVQRSGEGGGKLLLALGAGLGFSLTIGLLGSLGQGGRLPPLLAAVLPILLFGALGLRWLHRYDQ